ncbi:DNA ligase 3 [Desmophyllum pertusum]|uniref:DNA ligase 3 n=1 Tax=Desmophyllum pertusum TaxID=174260 RepID=A0A9X0A8A8_9CNID|nr:DNA ligase 3 [Desmophyllum pertusum]
MFGISIRNFQLVKRSSALYLYRRLVSVFSIMADGGGDEKPFLVEYASQGRAKCKTCKLQIEKTTTRIGKLVSNPFSEDGGMMKHWYHVPCIFDSLSRARATTKKIESTDDLDGFGKLKDDDQAKIVGLITDLATKSTKSSPSPKKKVVQATLAFGKPKPSTPTKSTAADNKKAGSSGDGGHSSSPVKGGSDENSKDNAFREFRRICARLAEEPSYNAKSKILADFFENGSSGGVNKRVYNLQSKQLIKLFSQIFGCSQDDMMTDLEQGDVSETVSTFHENSPLLKPMKKSLLSLQDVDVFLDKLKTVTKEDDQQRELTKMTKRCTANDLKFVIRLIKHDLRMNTGAKHVLDALDPMPMRHFKHLTTSVMSYNDAWRRKEPKHQVLYQE